MKYVSEIFYSFRHQCFATDWQSAQPAEDYTSLGFLPTEARRAFFRCMFYKYHGQRSDGTHRLSLPPVRVIEQELLNFQRARNRKALEQIDIMNLKLETIG